MIRIVAALLLLASQPAYAWWEYGHQLIARIGASELTPRARHEISRILARGAGVDTPNCPLRTIQDASVWPDCVRALPDRFKYSFPWHYQNIDTCKDFDIAEACPDGNCITAQIPRQLAIAADRHARPAERAMALAFAVHFIGDLHMPLHVGDRGEDAGGNGVHANYGSLQHTNLHAIWDGYLAERALTTPPLVTERSVTAAERRDWSKGSLADWTREGFEVSRTVTYGAVTGYAGSCAIKSDATALIGEEYIATATPVVREQVEKAGVRLAVLLNRTFAR